MQTITKQELLEVVQNLDNGSIGKIQIVFHIFGESNKECCANGAIINNVMDTTNIDYDNYNTEDCIEDYPILGYSLPETIYANFAEKFSYPRKNQLYWIISHLNDYQHYSYSQISAFLTEIAENME